ncbi:MAG: hypothetical protein ACJAUP_000278 [Cellvibrionaceae bacterium]|jgi:hypothetical protein
MYFWNILEIEPTSDKKTIKKAYARLIKHHKPETSPEAYQKIREAYDNALQYIKNYPPQNIGHHVAMERRPKKVERTPSKLNAIEVGNKIETDNIVVVEIAGKPLEAVPEPEYIDDSQKIDDLIKELKSKYISEDDINAIFGENILINLKNKKEFEEKLLSHLTLCEQSEYCYELAEKASEEFYWAKKYKHRKIYNKYYNLFAKRLDSARRYYVLEQPLQAIKSQYIAKSAEVAFLLTEEYNEKKLKRHLFFNIHRKDVGKYLKKLEKENPLAFDYDFNTQTVHWWKKKVNQYSLTFQHFLIGAIAGFLPSLIFLVAETEKTDNSIINFFRETNLLHVLILFTSIAIGIMLTAVAFYMGKKHRIYSEEIKLYANNCISFFDDYQSSTTKHAAITMIGSILIFTGRTTPEKIGSIIFWAGVLLLGIFYKKKIFYALLAILLAKIGLFISQSLTEHIITDIPLYLLSALLSHGIIMGYYCRKYGNQFRSMYSKSGYFMVYSLMQTLFATMVGLLFIVTGAAAWLS